jgi:hypothetical protein
MTTFGRKGNLCPRTLLKEIMVAEAQPGTEISTVRQNILFHNGHLGNHGTRHQSRLDFSEIFLWFHRLYAASSMARRARTDSHIS